MLRFVGGPAAGAADGLCVRRAPLFLRVVRDARGKWDALDQVGDTPGPGEVMWVYRRVGWVGRYHVRAAGGAGGMLASATYRFVAVQPDQVTMRDRELWEWWCWLMRDEETKGDES